MEMSRRRIHLIGASVVAGLVLSGSLLVVLPLLGAAASASTQADEATNAQQVVRARLTDLARRRAVVEELYNQVDGLRTQIPAQDERTDASVLAAAAAKSAGARIVAVTFADRQGFVAPTGLGLSEEGTPAAPRATAAPDTSSFQLPVTFEAEVSSAAQAAAFIDGLRTGSRVVQVVQAQSAATNNAQLFTLTVETLMFAAKD